MIILCSKSPRRIELLKSIYPNFLIIPSNIDEYAYSEDKISLEKAKAICNTYPNDIIISADTLVKMDDVVFGKPKSKEEAYAMLKKLSNKEHLVTTYYSIVLVSKNIYFTNFVESKVFFNDLSDETIFQYIETGSPFDKAGGYGIQDKSFNLINRIEGSYTNIVGLPIDELKKDLIKLGLLAQK